MWYKGKEYNSVNKWVGIFNKNYKNLGIKVNAHILHVLFNHYKIIHINVNKKGEVGENGNIVMYPKISVENITTRLGFIDTLKSIIDYYDELPVRKEVEERNRLASKKRIKIGESVFRRLFENFEGQQPLPKGRGLSMSN